MRNDLILSGCVFTGEDAVNLVLETEQPFDLILLDINLPDMTGIDFLERLVDIPFVIFTTAFDHYAVKAFELGAVDYLVKPISFDRFSKAIDRFIFIIEKSIPYDIFEIIEDLKGTDKYKKSSLSET